MSFIVKGAEMPKTCLDCPLSDIEQGWCASDMVTIIDFNKLPVECPLVALPDHHGELDEIEEAPTIEPDPRWIPCSNRLPDEEVLCCDTRGEMIIGYPYQDEESNTGYSAVLDDIVMIDCIAWMPKPEPYKGAGHE